MNNENTLDKKFIKKDNYSIWYYKELEAVDVDYVIAYLLKETFVVEINNSKHEITFGHNKKENYIGQCIRYDDIKNSNLCSFEVVEKGFREGKWFIVTDKDTSNEFKIEYQKKKKQYEKEEAKKFYKDILSNFIKEHKDLSDEQKNKHLQKINNELTYEELEKLVKILINRCE